MHDATLDHHFAGGFGAERWDRDSHARSYQALSPRYRHRRRAYPAPRGRPVTWLTSSTVQLNFVHVTHWPHSRR